MAKILVVDDDADMCLLTKLNLEGDGHQVETAATGAGALESALALEPDLIVLDVMMPDLDGFAVLRKLKERSGALVGVPVLMLTALGDPLERARGGIEGAVQYLTKPVDLDHLRTVVTETLAADEQELRRKAQQSALELVARIESNSSVEAGPRGPRVSMAGLEHGRSLAVSSAPPGLEVSAETLAELTDKQRALLDTIAKTPTIMEAAVRLDMSRSNIYASLRRIARRVGAPSVTELLDAVRGGLLDEPR